MPRVLIPLPIPLLLDPTLLYSFTFLTRRVHKGCVHIIKVCVHIIEGFGKINVVGISYISMIAIKKHQCGGPNKAK